MYHYAQLPCPFLFIDDWIANFFILFSGFNQIASARHWRPSTIFILWKFQQRKKEQVWYIGSCSGMGVEGASAAVLLACSLTKQVQVEHP
jgi:hypothetical protein